MSQTLLDCVEVETGAPVAGSVIWLHGLGADGHDFEALVPYLGVDEARPLRFVFPHAPMIPVTINMGMSMRAWYDITEMDLRRRHDEDGIRASAVHVERLIARENDRGIPTERILLAGFSQGGAVALHAGVRHENRLGGVMALSTYLVCEESVAEERTKANHDVPIFQAHGTHDPMVALDRGEHARDALQDLGYTIDWHTYPMAHQVCEPQIDDIGAWIRKCFEATS